MKVSIITACFNSASTIADCIESVNNQTYEDIEHIIIDGRSTDRTLNIINTLPNRVMKIVSEHDNGIYDAMNKGLSLATGDLVAILNSDDMYYDANVIKNIVDTFLARENTQIVYGDLVYVKKHDTTHVVRLWQSRTYYNQFFENGNVPPHPSLFLRSSVYKSAGLFDLSFRLAADYEFMFRIFKKFDFPSVHYPGVLVKMRYGGATNKNIRNILDQNREILKAWKVNGFKSPPAFMFVKVYKRLIQFIK